ncbi:MAG: hypothetical protein JWN04_2404 [Myxococcaceae bacterium]|nr:hypothetical protein [Myxococcaceae bacterium]
MKATGTLIAKSVFPARGRTGASKSRRESFFRWLSILSVVVAAFAASSNASAQHSYGILINGSVRACDADTGISCYINTAALASKDCANFADHEMWYGVVPGGQYWVEVGVSSGTGQAGCVNQAIFWADNRNGGGYHEHYPNLAWALNSTYELDIVQNGTSNCSWDVSFGTVYLGTSNRNCAGTGRYVAAGIETTSVASGMVARGTMSGWQERTCSNTWQSGWDNPALQQNLPVEIDFIGSITYEAIVN